MSGVRTLIVAEQAAEFGGTERVIAAAMKRFPEAIMVAPRLGVPNVPEGFHYPWDDRVRLFGRRGPRRPFLLPVYASRYAMEDLGPADIVLSFVHIGWSLAVRVPDDACHIAYLAGLPRSLYGQTERYLRDYPVAARAAARAALPALRRLHRRLLRRPHRLVTNSVASADALGSLSSRRPSVLYPPVRTSFFSPAPRPRSHFLAVARLKPSKLIDVLIEAFRRTGRSLVVVGGGTWLERYRVGAPPNVRFTGFVDDRELRELYRSSAALICPSVEDFGIVMAEALATGIPVIAPRAGGASEIVRDGATGILLDVLNPEAIAAAVDEVSRRLFDERACRRAAERFSEERFAAGLEAIITEELARRRTPAVRWRPKTQANGSRSRPPAGAVTPAPPAVEAPAPSSLRAVRSR
jgi:glycosyltransferase involved in cell wall biosynthesis